MARLFVVGHFGLKRQSFVKSPLGGASFFSCSFLRGGKLYSGVSCSVAMRIRCFIMSNTHAKAGNPFVLPDIRVGDFAVQKELLLASRFLDEVSPLAFVTFDFVRRAKQISFFSDRQNISATKRRTYRGNELYRPEVFTGIAVNCHAGMRRFTRLTNGFSKKLDNHKHALALYSMYYNFGRVHQTLRVTPAMEAGVTDRLWSLEDVVGIVDKWDNEKALQA